MKFKKKSPPLKLLSQSQPSSAEMILGWSPFKIVSVSAVLYPKWPPWKKEELGESSNYSIISKKVAHTLINSILFLQQSKVRLFIPFEMATILLFHSVDFLLPEILSSKLQ